MKYVAAIVIVLIVVHACERNQSFVDRVLDRVLNCGGNGK